MNCAVISASPFTPSGLHISSTFVLEFLALLLPAMRDAGLSALCARVWARRYAGSWRVAWQDTRVAVDASLPACLSLGAASRTHLSEDGITHMAAWSLSLPLFFFSFICKLKASLFLSFFVSHSSLLVYFIVFSSSHP